MLSGEIRSERYPIPEPYRQEMLPLDDIHTMYWEESGNPLGIPVLFIHGGPGAGSGLSARSFFDPSFYRIIVYDQRGAGRSTPLGELRENTTPHLIADIERLRSHLGIDQWLLFGGSWGSTLAIAYAEHHPGQCLGMILRGIFLCRPSEIDWFLYGMKTIFPEAWRSFSEYIPQTERNDLLEAYYQRLISPDPEVYLPAARSWSQYEGICATLMPSPETVATFLDDMVAVGLAKIEAYYFRNNIFLPDNFLLGNIDKIRSIPAVIIQGRYDIVCPIITADEVAQAWPEAEYIIVPDAGHSAYDPSLSAQLVKACERFKKTLK